MRGQAIRNKLTDYWVTQAELTKRNVAEKDLAIGLDENVVSAIKSGRYAKKAKDDFEQLMGKKVVSTENFL